MILKIQIFHIQILNSLLMIQKMIMKRTANPLRNCWG